MTHASHAAEHGTLALAALALRVTSLVKLAAAAACQTALHGLAEANARPSVLFAREFEAYAMPCPRLTTWPTLDLFDRPVVLANVAEPVDVDDVLQGNATIPIEVSPIRNMPQKFANGTCVRPAERLLALQQLLALLRTSPASRGYAAYVRAMPFWVVPEAAETLKPTLARARALAGPRVQQSSLWLGDGSMRSMLHHDALDNLLVQLRGEKRVLVLSPRAVSDVGYRLWSEHRFVFDESGGEHGSFRGYAPTDEPLGLENHAGLDVMADGEGAAPGGDLAAAARGASICTVHPGDALFIPALNPHAIVSRPAAAEPPSAGAAAREPPSSGALNMAANLWFVRGVRSHERALRLQPRWSKGYTDLGDALGLAERHDEAHRAFATAQRLRPDDFAAQSSCSCRRHFERLHTEIAESSASGTGAQCRAPE